MIENIIKWFKDQASDDGAGLMFIILIIAAGLICGILSTGKSDPANFGWPPWGTDGTRIETHSVNDAYSGDWKANTEIKEE